MYQNHVVDPTYFYEAIEQFSFIGTQLKIQRLMNLVKEC